MVLRIATNSSLCKIIVRSLSSEVVAKAKPIPKVIRTSADPLTHEDKHIGAFYTIPDDVVNNFFTKDGLPKGYSENLKTFGEASVMVRSPAVEIIKYLKKTNSKHPVIRYVLYGKPGIGKTMTLVHLRHYANLSGFITVHVPWVWNWYRRNFIEVAVSETKPGMYNLPLEAAAWLKYFQKTNSHILASSDLRLSKDYKWSQRETTPSGAPIQELVTHGISRIRYACDVIDVLINELKLLSSQGSCKTLIAIDGFNQFLLPFSNIKNPEKKKIVPDTVTLAQTFISAVQANWTNGAVIVTVDQLNTRDENASEKPLYLLGKRGFELLDPFVPVEVPTLSDFELNNMLDYYEDRKWLQKPEAREELDFVSARNPLYLMNVCAPL